MHVVLNWIQLSDYVDAFFQSVPAPLAHPIGCAAPSPPAFRIGGKTRNSGSPVSSPAMIRSAAPTERWRLGRLSVRKDACMQQLLRYDTVDDQSASRAICFARQRDDTDGAGRAFCPACPMALSRAMNFCFTGYFNDFVSQHSRCAVHVPVDGRVHLQRFDRQAAHR